MLTMRQITTEACQQRCAEVLRDHIGPGKQYGYQAAADALGMERRTIESYVLGESLPTLPKLMRLFSLLGPAMANRILRLAGLDGSFRQEPEHVSDLDLNADASKLVADVAQALRDGRIDQRDRARYINDVRVLAQATQEWLAQNDGVRDDPEREPCGNISILGAHVRKGDA